MNNEFILQDRIQKIQQIVGKYGKENFYISYSGGQDSNVLSALIDIALPDNKIPRVYCNTGIEYKAIVDFVKAKAAVDDRFIIIHPKVPIKQMLEEVGYPFKSKEHSERLSRYQQKGLAHRDIRVYLGLDKTKQGLSAWRPCPKILRHQFTPEYKLKVSQKCCDELKKKPMKEWQKLNQKPYAMIGLMREEGGQRNRANCLVFKDENSKTLKAFQPLVAVTKEWEKWFIQEHDVKLPIVYYPPYNFERTGCKGCPFDVNLQNDLDVMAQYFPNERKQCEIIWKQVYSEYRRLGYRLKKVDENQLTFDDLV